MDGKKGGAFLSTTEKDRRPHSYLDASDILFGNGIKIKFTEVRSDRYSQ